MSVTSSLPPVSPGLPDSGVIWEGIWWKDCGWFEFELLYARYEDVL